jgi:hypothetical protein
MGEVAAPPSLLLLAKGAGSGRPCCLPLVPTQTTTGTHKDTSTHAHTDWTSKGSNMQCMRAPAGIPNRRHSLI